MKMLIGKSKRGKACKVDLVDLVSLRLLTPSPATSIYPFYFYLLLMMPLISFVFFTISPCFQANSPGLHTYYNNRDQENQTLFVLITTREKKYMNKLSRHLTYLRLDAYFCFCFGVKKKVLGLINWRIISGGLK